MFFASFMFLINALASLPCKIGVSLIGFAMIEVVLLFCSFLVLLSNKDTVTASSFAKKLVSFLKLVLSLIRF